jgi:hypothetical protein
VTVATGRVASSFNEDVGAMDFTRFSRVLVHVDEPAAGQLALVQNSRVLHRRYACGHEDAA